MTFMANFIQRMYIAGVWTADRVNQAVSRGLITQEHADIILG